MNTDGSEKQQVTSENFRLPGNPAWTADSEYIVARKHFTTERSTGTGELWLYHVSGGKGVALVERPGPDHQKDQNDPAFSPDGRFLYFDKDTTPGARFLYAPDSIGQIFEILRFDTQTGEIGVRCFGCRWVSKANPFSGRTLPCVYSPRIDGHTSLCKGPAVRRGTIDLFRARSGPAGHLVDIRRVSAYGVDARLRVNRLLGRRQNSSRRSAHERERGHSFSGHRHPHRLFPATPKSRRCAG